MIYDADIEKMLKQVATSLKLGFQITKAPGGKVYNFIYEDKFLVRFTTFIDREGNIVFLVNFGSMSQRPLSWGSFKREELMTKTKKIIIGNTLDLIEKTNMISEEKEKFEKIKKLNKFRKKQGLD